MRITKVLWPIIIVCSALAALLAMRVFPSLPERPLFIMWFLFICPGMALVRLFHLKEFVVKLSLAVALSFSIDGIVVGIYLYAGHWSPLAMMLTLAALSIAAVVIEFTNVHVVVYNHVGFVRGFGALLTHPLIIGTSSVKPQSAGNSDVFSEPTVRVSPVRAMSMAIEEKPTLQMAKAPFSAAMAREVAIEEKSTLQMAKAPFSAAVAREAAIEEKSTVQMAKAQPSPVVARNVDVEEMPTVQIAKAQFSPAVAREVEIEETPTVQVAKSQLSPAPLSTAGRERFENQSTVYMPVVLDPSSAQRRAVRLPQEPQSLPAGRTHHEEVSENRDNASEQKNILHIATESTTSQVVHEDADKTLQVSKPRKMPGQPTTENSFPEGDDFEKKALHDVAHVAPLEQASIDDPDTQKLSEDNVDINTQRLVDGEVGRNGLTTNNPIRRKKRLSTKFTRIEN